MTKIEELEKTLLDQIEKLNDDTIFEDKEKVGILVERSKAISSLTQNFVNVQNMKLNVVKTLSDNGGLYENYLGVEDKTKWKLKLATKSEL